MVVIETIKNLSVRRVSDFGVFFTGPLSFFDPVFSVVFEEAGCFFELAFLKENLSQDPAVFELAKIFANGIQEFEGFIALSFLLHDIRHAAGPLGLLALIPHQVDKGDTTLAFEEIWIEI